MSREAWAVVDLGFGDAGKGATVDFLCRDRGADLVVRWHGGAQAGHNVVTPDGRHHTFSQWCAGTLADVPGLLGPDFLLHPLAMEVEGTHLRAIGVQDPWARVAVDARARVITPYQQAANHARERLRGEGAHGTCGVGVGECVADALAHPDELLRAGDLGDAATIHRRLGWQRARKRAELRELGVTDLALFDDDGFVDRVVAAWRDVAMRLRVLSPEATRARIDAARCLVLEGAQGVLLDETWGLHPHTTWSDCTFAGARALAGDRALTRLGVTRAWAVRHGPGPFPTEGHVSLSEAHNGDEGWQGRFRVGALDGVLLRYALQVCGGADALAVTGLDRLPRGPTCDAYLGHGPADLVQGSGGRVRRLRPGATDDLAHRRRLGDWLRAVDPAIEHGVDAVAFAEHATGLPVTLEARGPSAAGRRWRAPAAR